MMAKRLILVLVAALVLAASLRTEAGQTAAADSGLETLRGVVVSDEPAPKPLPRARVSVEWDGGRSDSVSTDEQGRFETRAPASRPSVLKVTKAGFAPAEVRRGRNAANRPIDVRLARGAVVTGTVVDRAGAPVAGLSVVVRRADAQSGGAPAAPEPEADTDDRGEFRVGSLPAGRYELVINPFRDIHLVTPTNGGATEMRLKYLGRGGQTTSVVQLSAGEETTVHLVQEEPGGENAFVLGKLSEMKREVEGSRAADSRRRASIQGRITDMNGRPVAGALVRALSDDGDSLVVDSDDEGRYTVTGLPVGAVQIVASKTGFVQTAYGGGVANRAGRRIAVTEGHRVTGVDVSLQRGSVIAGAVVDESGDPAEGVVVELWQSRFTDGHEMVSRVTDVATAKTDDRGHYRLFGVQPGDYYVGVIRGERGTRFSGEASFDGGEVVISASMVHIGLAGVLDAPLFYPGRVAVADALQVPVDAGQDAFGIDIGLVSTRLARVRGEVINGSGQPFRGSVSLAVSGRSGAPILEPRTVSVSDGTFEFENVAPGDYVIQARADGFHVVVVEGDQISSRRAGPKSDDDRSLVDGVVVILDTSDSLTGAGSASKDVRIAGSIEPQPEFGMAFVTVGDGDALTAPVFIQTAAGSTMTGQLVLEGAASVSGVTLRATPVDLDYAPRDGKPASTAIGVGRDFELKGLTGSLRFDLDGHLPDGWWLKSVSIDGVNAADEPVTFGTSSQSRRGVEVVLSNDAAEISGQVTGATQGSGASIVVFPTAPERWYERSRYIKVTRADRNGRFTIGGLPPGEYWVAAPDAGFVSPDSGTSLRPDVLTALTASARRVTLREAGRVSVEVRKR